MGGEDEWVVEEKEGRSRVDEWVRSVGGGGKMEGDENNGYACGMRERRKMQGSMLFGGSVNGQTLRNNKLVENRGRRVRLPYQ